MITGICESGKMSAMLVIFGGTGDLTHRKLIPALYNLIHDELMPQCFSVVCIGRRDKTDDEYRDEVYESLRRNSRNRIDERYWSRLRELSS
jgi:glucose-6-phosphate 1-dehydrogenase